MTGFVETMTEEQKTAVLNGQVPDVNFGDPAFGRKKSFLQHVMDLFRKDRDDDA